MKIILKPFFVFFRVFSVYLLTFYFSSQAVKGQTAPDTTKINCEITVRNQKDSSLLAATNILIKGKSISSSTDETGFVRMTIMISDSILLLTREGFLPEEINIVSFPEYKSVVFLKAEEETWDRGYSLQSISKSFPGQVSNITGAIFQRGHFSSFENGIQGQAAGIHSISSTGNLNSYSSVLMRGVGTTFLGTEPHYVLDGVPITSGSEGDGGGGIGINFGYNTSPLAEINASDIQSIQFLKGGSASALYGGRGANGVVEIFTKRGTPGKTLLNVGYQQGILSPTNKVEFLNGPDYLNATSSAFARSYYYDPNNVLRKVPIANSYISNTSNPYISENVAYYTNTNGVDQMLRNGSFNQVDLSASGGNKLVKFFFGGTYLDQKGIQKNNEGNRLSVRFNTDVTINSGLKFGSSLYFSLSQTFMQPSGLNNFGGGFAEAQTTALPYNPGFFDQRNNSKNPYVSFNPYFNAYDGSNIELLTDRKQVEFERQVFRSIGNVYGEVKVKFIPGLRFRGDVGFDYHSNFDRTYQSRFTRKGQDINVEGDTVLIPSTKASDFRAVYFNLSYSGLTDYTKSFGRHNFRLFAGINGQQITNENNGISSENFASSFSKLVSFGSRFSDRPEGFESGSAFSNYFYGLDYDFSKKYFLSISQTLTASTRYGANIDFVAFPAVSFGWDVFNESWFPKNSVVSGMYLNAGSSLTGNSLMTNTQPRGYWRGNLPYVDPGSFQGRYLYTLPSLELEPEKSMVNEVEVRSSFFKERLFATIGYFDRTTLNAIFNYPLPPSQGIDAGYFVKNGGKIRNNGIELSLGAAIIKKDDFAWNVQLNGASLQNKVTSTDGLKDGQTNSFFELSASQGNGTSSFLLPKWGGFANADDPNGKWRKGDELIYNKEGQLFKPGTLGQIDSAAVISSESSLPKFYGGFTNVIRYKQFTFDFLLTFSYGNHILDAGERIQSYMTGQSNIRKSVNNENLFYVGESDSSLTYTNLLSQRNTTRFLHDASYIRLKNVGLTYAFPKNRPFLKKAQGASVFVRVQNVLTFTSFNGWDPEALSNTTETNQRSAGIGSTFFDLPQYRTFLIGFNISL